MSETERKRPDRSSILYAERLYKQVDILDVALRYLDEDVGVLCVGRMYRRDDDYCPEADRAADAVIYDWMRRRILADMDAINGKLRHMGFAEVVLVRETATADLSKALLDA